MRGCQWRRSGYDDYEKEPTAKGKLPLLNYLQTGACTSVAKCPVHANKRRRKYPVI